MSFLILAVLVTLTSPTPAQAEFYPVCQRAYPVRSAIESKVKKPCAQITESDLDLVDELLLGNSESNQLLPNDLQGLKKMRRFTFHDNFITEIPEHLFDGLVSLQHISFQNNYIRKIPADLFKDTEALAFLNLSQNYLTELPRGLFKTTAHLSHVNFSQNFILEFDPKVFEGLARVDQLNLDKNSITFIPANALEFLPQVTSVNLDLNRIDTIDPDAFTGALNLKYVELRGNRLKTLSRPAMENLKTFSVYVTADIDPDIALVLKEVVGSNLNYESTYLSSQPPQPTPAPQP